MAEMTRRTLVQSMAFAGLGLRLASGAGGKLAIGITDWNLKLTANPDALSLAKRIGFDGVQVSFGRRLVDGKMPLDDPATISRYLRLSAEQKIPIDGTCVDKLHDNGLKSDKLAVRWVLDAIRLTNALRASVLLLPVLRKMGDSKTRTNAMRWAMRFARSRRKPKRPG